MSKYNIFSLTSVVILVVMFFWLSPSSTDYYFSPSSSNKNYFELQSVDTMKYSRDTAEQMLNNPTSAKKVIEEQVQLISDVGATHISLGTPYDERFIPVIQMWVDSARVHGLSIWYRGNFSGWESWFGYSKISRETHKYLLSAFLIKHPELFKDGDIFSPCPECENGGPGDPRVLGDKSGYNNFLIDEYNISKEAFKEQNKKIRVLFSMNGDIARDVINSTTAEALGGVILIDHYVKTPEKFVDDIVSISKKNNTEVGVGEFGAPVPDLNGWMSEADQAKYIESMFDLMYSKSSNISIVNYWVLSGGSTALVADNGKTKSAYNVVKTYFNLPKVTGRVTDALGNSIDGVKIKVIGTNHGIISSFDGEYSVFLAPKYRKVSVEKEGYKTLTLDLPKVLKGTTYKNIILEPIKPTLLYKIKYFFRHLKTLIFVSN